MAIIVDAQVGKGMPSWYDPVDPPPVIDIGIGRSQPRIGERLALGPGVLFGRFGCDRARLSSKTIKSTMMRW